MPTPSTQRRRISRRSSPTHPHHRGADLAEAEHELAGDVFVDRGAIEPHDRLEIGVHALERAEDRVERFVAGSVHEAGLPARHAQSRGGAEHLVEPVVERGDSVLEDLLLVRSSCARGLRRREVVELEEDPLHEREVFEHEQPLGIAVAPSLHVVHLHGDRECRCAQSSRNASASPPALPRGDGEGGPLHRVRRASECTSDTLRRLGPLLARECFGSGMQRSEAPRMPRLPLAPLLMARHTREGTRVWKIPLSRLLPQP